MQPQTKEERKIESYGEILKVFYSSRNLICRILDASSTKSLINDDPELTLTNSTTRSSLATQALLYNCLRVTCS